VGYLTAVVQIGNSDDCLTQHRWCEFIERIDAAIGLWRQTTHFQGCSPGNLPWQNACWVFTLAAQCVPALRDDLARYARDFGQESIALTLGETEFVTGDPT
jgi:hypothetical protein